MGAKTRIHQSLKLSRIEQMFSGIAPWYDFLNRLLSLRRDVIWRRELVQGIGLFPQATILDLAAGTLDVSLEIVSQKPGSRVVAADFSLAMLMQGKGKLKLARAEGSILPVAADAYALPFTEAKFDALTIAFGIRNLPDRVTALKEMHRVLKPGGVVAILEFIPPESGWLQNLYKIYLNHLLPIVGRLFSQHTFAYSYLAESINNFPTAEAFSRQMQAVGFEQVRKRLLTFGVAYLFFGKKKTDNCQFNLD
jgi:demethylmenaquinone methyltransferase / 2-methoxy-6-polyprenyl-1,4-benzoquinol methylase